MKLFLFSASVFFFLGLKLISQIDITPSFYHKPVSIETTTVPSTKDEVKKLGVMPGLIKKDTVNSAGPKSDQRTAPSVKSSKK